MKFGWRWMPFLCGLGLLAIFTRGLFLEPQVIPSAQIGQKLPNMFLPTLSGESSHLEKYDQSTYLLTVWASWCDACADEQEFLLKLAAQGVILVGLNYKDQPEQAKQWLATWKNPYQQLLLDQEGHFAMELGVYGAPETFLIGPNRQILHRHTGVLTPQVWEKEYLPRMKQ